MRLLEFFLIWWMFFNFKYCAFFWRALWRNSAAVKCATEIYFYLTCIIKKTIFCEISICFVKRVYKLHSSVNEPYSWKRNCTTQTPARQHLIFSWEFALCYHRLSLSLCLLQICLCSTRLISAKEVKKIYIVW